MPPFRGPAAVQAPVRTRRPTGVRPLKAVVILLASCFLFQIIADAQVRETRRVLVLNDLGVVSSPGFAEIDQAIYSVLQKSRYQIEFYEESLELTLFPDEVSRRRFREEFIRKYSGRKLDVIIAAGSDSLKFIADSDEKFLRDTPIIFCTILGEIPDRLRPDMHFTGVLGSLQPEETLNAALRLLPGTKHVVVTGGMGQFDYRWEAIANQSFNNYESKLDFTYLTDLTMPTLQERLRNLPNNTVVYHTSLSQDAAGERFIDSAQAVPLLASAANAPVFVMDDVDLRGGTVGGDLVNWADDARVAAGMAVRVLNGEKPQDIPIAKSKNVYMFDWRALRRWGIKEDSLPPGSIVLNLQPTFWELYWRYVITGVFLFFAQMLVILGLLWQRAQRRTVQTELTRSHGQLRESEERLRLAVQAGRMYAFDWNVATDEIVRSEESTHIFGLTGEPVTLTKRELLDRVYPEDRVRFMNSLECTPGRPNTQISYRLLRPDGSVLWLERTGHASFDEHGKMVRMTGMVADITERKLAEEALSTVSQRLIEAQEQERSRLARELHDDINQQLALLAINLESLKQGVPDSAVGLAQGIGKTIEQIADVGKDIQALSHRLHSSKLEYLGLEAAAKSFCREFSDQQKVEISFQSENIPKELPQEISVCLFRVLQEALQNATKHSGSRQFQVSLRDGTNQIELTVRDSGVGFDPEETIKGRGLGLTSMRERLKLVNGELSIYSQLQRGTTIQARVPLKPRTQSVGAAG